MKLSKFMAALTCAVFMGGAVYAQTSSTNVATARTIKVDADKMMDVNEWSKTAFKKNFVFGAVGTQTYLEGGFATKTLKNVYLGGFYHGDLWSENPINQFDVIFGTKDLGIKAGLDITKHTAGGINLTVPTMTAEVGYNLLGGKLQLDGSVGFGVAFDTDRITVGGIEYTTVSSIVMPSFSADVAYQFMNKKGFEIWGGLYYGFSDATGSRVSGYTGTTKASNVENTLSPRLEVKADITKNMKYGMRLTLPFNFSDTVVTDMNGDKNITHNVHNWAPVLSNGLTATDLLKGMMDFNMGIRTALPVVTFTDDSARRQLSNSYYVGAAFHFDQSLTIDTSATVFNGSRYESLDDIWKTDFSFTVSMNF